MKVISNPNFKYKIPWSKMHRIGSTDHLDYQIPVLGPPEPLFPQATFIRVQMLCLLCFKQNENILDIMLYKVFHLQGPDKSRREIRRQQGTSSQLHHQLPASPGELRDNQA